MDPFKEQVKKGFQACKQDISDVAAQQQELSSKITSLESENSSLRNEISELKSLLTSFKEEIKSFNSKKVEEALYETPKVSPVRREPAVQEASKDPYEALLAFKAKANKRDLLKQKMMNMIGENGMMLAELKFMFVDHFKYSSKATFYNYLKELELEKSIHIERENSKNVVYLNTISEKNLI